MLDLLSLLAFIPFYYVREVYYFILRNRPMKDIRGEHILITGSAQGIGAVFALKFAQLGNTVHCVDVCEELNQSTVQGLIDQGHSAYAYTCDLTKMEAIEQLYKEVKENGTVTYVVNNAGVALGRNFTELTGTQIEYVLKVNLLAQFLVVKQFLPEMLALNHGHIINIASLAGLFPTQGCVDYCASKAGSLMFTEALGAELAATNIQTTAVCPFFVNTNMIRGIEDKVGFVLQPEDLVDIAIKGVREGKSKILVPRSFYLLKLVKDILPAEVASRIRLMSTNTKKANLRTYIGQGTADKIK